MNKIIITKRIARQGRNNVIIIPTYLKHKLPAGALFKIEIEQVDEKEPNETKLGEVTKNDKSL